MFQPASNISMLSVMNLLEGQKRKLLQGKMYFSDLAGRVDHCQVVDDRALLQFDCPGL